MYFWDTARFPCYKIIHRTARRARKLGRITDSVQNFRNLSLIPIGLPFELLYKIFQLCRSFLSPKSEQSRSFLYSMYSRGQNFVTGVEICCLREMQGLEQDFTCTVN